MTSPSVEPDKVGRPCCCAPTWATSPWMLGWRQGRSRSASVLCSTKRRHVLPHVLCSHSDASQTQSFISSSSSSSSSPPSILLPLTPILKRPPPPVSAPQLALFSLLFVLSTAIGAIFSLAVISFPTINVRIAIAWAFRKLAASIHNLSRVVSEEVPGTLSSLKLSGLEISDLTRQLSALRQMISATAIQQHGNKAKRKD